jgi:hypothetical protein
LIIFKEIFLAQLRLLALAPPFEHKKHGSLNHEAAALKNNVIPDSLDSCDI